MSAPNDIEGQAARWLMRRMEPDWAEQDEAALQAWLDESMGHKAAYWRLQHGWHEAGRIAALGAAPAFPPGVQPGRSWWSAAIAASLLLALGLGAVLLRPEPTGWFRPDPALPEQFATDIGRRKIVSLEDGSRVELNTATTVRAAVTRDRREFWLDEGEAYFEVAHAADRPFVVHAGSRIITVLGTKFSVRRDGGRVSVSVVEGRVRIDQADERSSGPSTTITGGAVALAEGSSTLVAANSAERVENALSWREGMVTLDQVTLVAAAAEFNRYNRRKLIIADPEAAAIRIGGTFQASNVDAFVRLLRDAYDVEVEVREEAVTISR